MKTIIFTLCILVASCMFANPVDVKTASLVAENYYNSNAKVKANDLSLTYQEITSTGDTAIFYVFNINRSDGWIIVAATDASYPVLGYSPSGNYSKQDQPPAFIYWMEGYKNQILDIIRRRIPPTTEINAEWATYKSLKGGSSNKSPLTVGPLLSTTWNQGQYYNAWCPGGCPTGCVATAMAQIMKYWNYPAIGTGDHCYQHPAYGQICANFGNTTYNWSAMPNNVTSSNTAVATLMYHCGVSVNMDYCQNGSNASGAWVLTNDHIGYHPNSAQNAYPTYFGYSSNTLQGLMRSGYSDSYWINNILKPELDAAKPRPIQYAAWENNGQSAHTWVCDGYNSNNQFWMNWGWGPNGNNGWFTVNNLTPGSHNYDENHQVLIGIRPNKADLIPVSQSLSSSSIQAGSNATAYCAEDNQGTLSAGANVVSIHLSSNNVLTPGSNGDTWIGEISIPNVAANSCSNVYSGSIQIPAGTSAGNYYVFFSADGGQAVTEYNELNNFTSVQITVSAGSGSSLPNDDPCNAILLPVNQNCVFIQGTNVGATNSSVPNVYCDGTSNGDLWYKCIVPDNGTVSMTTDAGSIDDIGGAAYTETCNNLTLIGCFANGSTYSPYMPMFQLSGLTPGSILWIRLWEFNNNNFGTFYICVTSSGGSSGDDFYVQGQSVTPTSVAAGGSLNASASQCYSGTTPDASMGSVYLGYYLSPTPTYNSSTAVYLDEDPSGLGSDDPCNAESETLTIPTGTAPGTYYLLFFADHDNAFVETNENNNVVSVQITITGGSSGDDFYVQNQTATPTSIAAGGTIDVTASQCYSGTTPDASMGSVYLGYYLSPTPTFNSSTAVYLDEDPSGLGSDDPCNAESETLTIPAGTAPGTYYLLFFADHDNAFVETNENNNVVSVQITITGGSSGDDFYVQNQTAAPTSIAAGGTIDVTASQCYSGTTPDAGMGSVYLGYYLSPTPTFNSSTAVYLDEDPSGLGSDDPCNAESETLTIPIGTAPGTYYLLFFADHDNTFVETNENNNVSSVQINVIQSNFNISTVSSPANGGTTSGGGTFPSGTYITLSANPNIGYIFTTWTVNGTVVSTNSNYSFTVTANRVLVANFTATSQNLTKPTFAKLYDDFNDLNAFNGVIDFAQSTIDSSYLVGGQYSYTGSSNDGFYFFKVDKNGNLIWSKEISDFNAVIHSIVKSVNGYMISFGINNEAAIMEVNEGGNVLWSKKLDLYIQNFTSTQGGYIGTYSFMNTLNLVKLDFEGNLLWSRIFNYDNPNGEYVYCEKLASDYYGNIYLLGGIQNPNFFSSQNGIIQKVSPDGNPIWCKQISTYDNYADNLTGFVIDNYSNLYFGLWTNDNYGELSNGYIGKLNSSGALSSLKQLPVSVFPELFSISQTGDVVQAWYGRDFQTTILSLDPALDIIDLKTFEYQGLWIAKSTLDHNIMFGGYETVYRLNGQTDLHFNMFKVSMNHNSCIDAQQQTMALTNSSVNVNSIAVSTINSGITLLDFTVNPINTTLLDSTLCDDSGIFTSTNEIISVAVEENKFSIFPNPTSGQFTLKAVDLKGDKYRLEIIDGTGRTDKRLTINTVDGHISQTIDVDDLPDGIYMLRISSSGYNQSLKLIVQ
jgi:hypothetical protein